MRFLLAFVCCCIAAAHKANPADASRVLLGRERERERERDRAHAESNEEAGDTDILMLSLSDGRNLVFMHIPKTGGTTVENTGKIHGIDWGRNTKESFVQALKPSPPRCPVWHVPPAFFGANSPYTMPQNVVFAVTRDPWARMLSEFQYRKRLRSRNIRSCSKDEFNRWTHVVLQEDMYAHDCHLVPQWDYIEGPEGQKYVHDENIVPITELATRFPQMLERYNVSMTLAPPANDAHKCANLEKIDKAELFDSKSKAMMRARYARDFQHLGDSLIEAHGT